MLHLHVCLLKVLRQRQLSRVHRQSAGRCIRLPITLVVGGWPSGQALHMEEDGFAILLGDIGAAAEDVAHETIKAAFWKL